MIAKTPESIQELDSSDLNGGVQKSDTSKDLGVLLDTNGKEFKLPDYTIQQLRGAIPKHCFERSAARGYAYILRDLSLLAGTFYLFNTYATPEYVPNRIARFGLWSVYGFLQGLFGTGLWVIAHECGHQAFSPSKVVNDTTGWVLHSALLVPYFSWKISHGKHHKATGHMERDMVHMPKTRSEYARRVKIAAEKLGEVAEDSPIYALTYTITRQIAGWPMYLMTNRTGHNCHEKQPEGRGKGKVNGFTTGVNHFSMSSPLFEAKDAKLILLSDLGIGLAATGLYFLGQRFGSWNMLVWYVVPYLWVNHWLVAITYLQHTDPTLPHYTPESWNYIRGAAATIDREFGFIGRHLFHGIIETHVLHHYISTIPFYHADEATEAIKPIMGDHYRSDTKGGAWAFIPRLFSMVRECQWVEPSEGAKGEGKGVLFFRNRNNIGVGAGRVKFE